MKLSPDVVSPIHVIKTISKIPSISAIKIDNKRNTNINVISSLLHLCLKFMVVQFITFKVKFYDIYGWWIYYICGEYYIHGQFLLTYSWYYIYVFYHIYG